VALDGSPTALAEARRRVHGAHVKYVQARLPDEMPRGPFDLIVVSEIAYYLSVHELALLGRRLAAATAPRGKIVLLHHRRHFQDAAQLPCLAHFRLRSQLSFSATAIFEERYPRFDVVALRKRHEQTTGTIAQLRERPAVWERPSRTRTWVVIAERWRGRYTVR
jgi:hypothetical protein